MQWQFHRWQPTGQASAPTTSQTPFNGKTLHPGEVAQVASTNGARMQPAADGMIRSYGTTVKIAETGTADMVSDASTAIARPPGARCWRSP